MRIDIAESAEILVEMLKDDPDYQNYHILWQKIEQNPELCSRVNEFRRKNFELQNRSHNPEQDLWNLNPEYQELCKIALASEYLEAESSVCRTIQDIVKFFISEIRIPEL